MAADPSPSVRVIAFDSLDSHSELEPDDLVNFADALDTVGRCEEAVDLLGVAMEHLKPGDKKWRWVGGYRALLLAESAHFKRADQIWRELEAAPTEMLPATYATWGTAHLNRGQFDDALEILHRGRKADGETEFIDSALAYCYRALGRYDEAMQHAETALSCDPDDPEALELVTDLSVRNEPRPKEELASSADRNSVSPSRTIVLFEKAHDGIDEVRTREVFDYAEALRIVRRYSEAIDLFTRLEDLPVPEDKKYLLSWSRGLAHQGARRSEDALEAFQVSYAKHPSPDALIEISSALRSMEKFDTATELMEEGLYSDCDEDEKCEMLVELALSLRGTGHYREALTHASAAQSAEPNREEIQRLVTDLQEAITALSSD